MKIDEKEILNKRFGSSKNGYNPDEVDDFLDKVIESFSEMREMKDKELEEARKIKEENKKLKDEIHKLEISNLLSNNKLSSIADSNNVTGDNINLIKRINALEKFLYQNGYNPSKIK